jgi:uncharacterized protein YndB with AHSA1/START domain
MSETIELSRLIPARPERVFNAWLDASEHSLMTGGEAATVNEDGSYTAYDGYISGRTLERKPHERIVQTWRSTEFPDGAPDSRLEVVLEPDGDGTKLTLKHSDIPDGQGESYRQGWEEHYFEPMTQYFQSPRSKLKDAGEVIATAAHEAQEVVQQAAAQMADTMETVGEGAQKAAQKVQQTAKKAASTVKKLVNTAKKRLQAARAKPKPKKAAPKKKAAAAKPKKKAAPKKKKPAAKAKKKR